jgi:hypothetical protein
MLQEYWKKSFKPLAAAALALSAAIRRSSTRLLFFVGTRTENRELRTDVEGRRWAREIHRKAEEHVSFEPVRYGKSRG